MPRASLRKRLTQAERRTRDEWIRAMRARPGKGEESKSLDDDVDAKLHDQIVNGNGQIAVWFRELELGKATATVKQEIPDTAVFVAYAEAMAEEGLPFEQMEALTQAVVAKLKGRRGTTAASPDNEG
jgi:hypothetical protein